MNWDYLAGFFDGDGSINFLLQRNRNVLDFSLDIYQEDASVLRSLRAFLESEGLMGAEIRMSHRAYEIRWRNKKSILRIATNLVDRTVVKRQQLQAVIDYLESRITGDDFVRVMNEEVVSRRRKGSIRELPSLRMTRSEAIAMRQRRASRSAAELRRKPVTIAWK